MLTRAVLMPSSYSEGLAFQLKQAVGAKVIMEHEASLTAKVLASLSANTSVKVLGSLTASLKSGHPFLPENLHTERTLMGLF